MSSKDENDWMNKVSEVIHDKTENCVILSSNWWKLYFGMSFNTRMFCLNINFVKSCFGLVIHTYTRRLNSMYLTPWSNSLVYLKMILLEILLKALHTIYNSNSLVFPHINRLAQSQFQSVQKRRQFCEWQAPTGKCIKLCRSSLSTFTTLRGDI